MTILGQHTIAETRDLIRSVEFRVNKYLTRLQQLQMRRLQPTTAEQQQLDSDMTTFVKRWVDVRDTNTLAMAAGMAANPGVIPDILPAESNWVAIQKAFAGDEPRLIDLQNRIDIESNGQGFVPVDLSTIPGQNSPDVDFLAMRKLDAAIAAAGNPLGKPGGTDSVLTSPLGLILIVTTLLVAVGGVVYVKTITPKLPALP